MKDFIRYCKILYLSKAESFENNRLASILSRVNPLDKTYQGLLQELFHEIKMFLDIFAQKLTESPF
jgi:hypothetical protein